MTRDAKCPPLYSQGILVNGAPSVVIRNCVFRGLHNAAIHLISNNVRIETNLFIGQVAGKSSEESWSKPSNADQWHTARRIGYLVTAALALLLCAENSTAVCAYDHERELVEAPDLVVIEPGATVEVSIRLQERTTIRYLCNVTASSTIPGVSITSHGVTGETVVVGSFDTESPVFSINAPANGCMKEGHVEIRMVMNDFDPNYYSVLGTIPVVIKTSPDRFDDGMVADDLPLIDEVAGTNNGLGNAPTLKFELTGRLLLGVCATDDCDSWFQVAQVDQLLNEACNNHILCQDGGRRASLSVDDLTLHGPSSMTSSGFLFQTDKDFFKIQLPESGDVGFTVTEECPNGYEPALLEILIEPEWYECDRGFLVSVMSSSGEVQLESDPDDPAGAIERTVGGRTMRISRGGRKVSIECPKTIGTAGEHIFPDDIIAVSVRDSEADAREYSLEANYREAHSVTSIDDYWVPCLPMLDEWQISPDGRTVSTSVDPFTDMPNPEDTPAIDFCETIGRPGGRVFLLPAGEIEFLTTVVLPSGVQAYGLIASLLDAKGKRVAKATLPSIKQSDSMPKSSAPRQKSQIRLAFKMRKPGLYALEFEPHRPGATYYTTLMLRRSRGLTTSSSKYKK
jgi:hypothetical protein